MSSLDRYFDRVLRRGDYAEPPDRFDRMLGAAARAQTAAAVQQAVDHISPAALSWRRERDQLRQEVDELRRQRDQLLNDRAQCERMEAGHA